MEINDSDGALTLANVIIISLVHVYACVYVMLRASAVAFMYLAPNCR